MNPCCHVSKEPWMTSTQLNRVRPFPRIGTSLAQFCIRFWLHGHAFSTTSCGFESGHSATFQSQAIVGLES